ncbi:MAG: DUF2141 domain-containing protein [Allosphingosinicella sp.]
MRALILSAAGLAAWSAPLPAQADAACTGHPSATRLYVRVEGVRSAEGLVAVTLYPDDRARFLAHRGSLYVGRVPAVKGTTRACIYVPAPGAYAIAAYHDADGNRHLTKNAIGFPAEGGGFSNNPNTFLGLPSFSASRFTVKASGEEIRIRLRYP